MNGKIEYSTSASIATLSFSHPKGNAMPGALLNELAGYFTQIGTDSSIKVIILKSEGEKVFCAGASFDELLSLSNVEEGKKFFSGFAKVILAMRNCRQLVIAQVQGKAVGGGVGLAAAADYCLATEQSAIKLSELAIGIGPFVIEPAVNRKLGHAALSELTLNPTEWRSAQWAYQHGLYLELTDSIESLEKRVQEKATELSVYSPEAMSEIKKMLWKDTDNWPSLLMERAQISGRLALSDETQEALQKFRESRS